MFHHRLLILSMTDCFGRAVSDSQRERNSSASRFYTQCCNVFGEEKISKLYFDVFGSLLEFIRLGVFSPCTAYNAWTALDADIPSPERTAYDALRELYNVGLCVQPSKNFSSLWHVLKNLAVPDRITIKSPSVVHDFKLVGF